MANFPLYPLNDPHSREQAQDALEKARAAQEEAADLRRRLDRLEMVCEGLWTLLKQRTGATEAELLQLVEEIDLRDGSVNGRTAPTPQKCGHCGHVVSARTLTCLYCGAQNFSSTVF